MSPANNRLNAVVAALEQVRVHISEATPDADIDAKTYNRWIEMLDGVVDGNWQALILDDDVFPPKEILMHVDAAIAFLKAHQES